MSKRFKAARKEPAGHDDSLEVHPATQAEPSGSAENRRAASSDDEDGDAVGEEDDEDAASADSQGYYEAEAIASSLLFWSLPSLGLTPLGNAQLNEDKTRYLIAWKGTDVDGKPWEPTWEPQANANELLRTSWRQRQREARKAAKAAKAAEKKRKLEVKTAKQAKKAPAPVAAKAKQPAAKPVDKRQTSSPSSPRKVGCDFVLEIDVPPSRPNAKRKMIVPSSPSSSASGQTAKKSKPNAPEVAQLPQPQPAPAPKRVSFDLSSSTRVKGKEPQAKVAVPVKQPTHKPAIKVAPVKSVEVAVSAARKDPDDEDEPEIMESSGSTTASASAVIPDSQAVTYTPMLEKPEEPVASGSRTMRVDLTLHSPATSQSDLEDVHAHDHDHDDDVPVFSAFPDDDQQTSSPEVQPTRRLGPVPVPAASMFGIFEQPGVRSSQFDPIEDPDSSPNRPLGLDGNSAPARASPRGQVVKQRLELVNVHEEDTPVSSFEAEVKANAASSYVTTPLEARRKPGLASQIRIVRARPQSPRTHSYVASSLTVKRAPVQAAHAVEEIDAGGSVARVGRRGPSPFADEDDSVMTQAEDEDFGAQADQFFDSIFDWDAGAQAETAIASGSTEGAQDAGENGTPSNGHSQAYDSPQQSANPTQSHPADQSAYASTSANQSANYGSGFTASGSNTPNPLSQFPQQPTWPGAPSTGTPKRQHEEEDDANDSKKPRVDASAASQYPESAHAHSPYHALPEHPSFQTGSHVAGPSYQEAVDSASQQPAASQTQLRIPSVGITQVSPMALASPSLARVQNTDPFVIPKPNLLASGEPSPSLARAAAGFRSPSPLPAGAAPTGTSQPAAVGSRNVSRTNSPAPTSAQVEDLISLVRASPYISATDGTQDELERFLRDPQAYPTIPNAPLLTAEFWAFELRRHTVDGVEKVDFILIRSREGVFQLKRANTEKFPIEFSRSLSQITTRARGVTPMVEGAPSVAPYAPSAGTAPAAAPVQPSTAQMSRTQLEIEVGRLRKQVAASDAELSSLRPLTAEVAQLRSDVQSLTKQTKSLQSSRESAQADLSYMQAQYQAASQAAVERANECRVAEAEAARLRGMLDNAVQQKEAVYKSEIKAVRSMYSRLAKQMAFYKDESRRTQEAAIREKAARWDDYVASNQLKAAAAERARAGLTAEDSGDEAAAPAATAGTESLPEPSTIVSSGSSSTSPAQGPPRLPSHVPASSLGIDSLPADVSQPDRPLAADASNPSSSAGGGDVIIGGAAAAAAGRDEFRCEWRVGSTDTLAETCGEAKESRTQLREHVLREHMHD